MLKMQKIDKGKLEWLLASVFVLTELLLAFVIQLVPARQFGTFAYLSIILVFAFSHLRLSSASRFAWLIRLGLLFTLAADFFLVALVPERALAGVSVFVFVQLSYAAYLYLDGGAGAKRCVTVLLRVILSMAALVTVPLVLGGGTDALSLISVLYYAQLLSNLVTAIVYKRPLFALALFLFALCDLSIGINEIVNSYIGAGRDSFWYALANTEVNLAWVFYLPSQVLISLYAVFNKK